MADAKVNQALYVRNHNNILHLKTTHPSSRLSLKRTTQLLNKPCYNEEDSPPPSKRPAQDTPPSIPCPSQEEEHPSPEPSPNNSSCESDGVKERVQILGLPNCGNTCFVNSILQVLRFTPRFAMTVHSLLAAQHWIAKSTLSEECSNEMNFFKNIHALYMAMKRKELLMRKNENKNYNVYLMKPVAAVINSLREVSSLFEEGEQHDAHEFLLTLISTFCTALQSLKPPTNDMDTDTSMDTNGSFDMLLDAMDDTPSQLQLQRQIGRNRKGRNSNFDFGVLQSLSLGFEGKIRHVVQCLECERRIENEESVANLEVNIPELDSSQDTVDLKECLSQTTILCGDNKYLCGDCLRHNEARMSTEVITAPEIMLLHVSWHSSNEITNTEKARVKVTIPMSLDTSAQSHFFRFSPHERYRLYAMVLHIGRSALGGHYVCLIRDSGDQPPVIEGDKPRPRGAGSQFAGGPELCCVTDEMTRFDRADDEKWLLFDDEEVNLVVVDDGSESFPYYNYLSTTASPCLIFYHKAQRAL